MKWNRLGRILSLSVAGAVMMTAMAWAEEPTAFPTADFVQETTETDIPMLSGTEAKTDESAELVTVPSYEEMLQTEAQHDPDEPHMVKSMILRDDFSSDSMNSQIELVQESGATGTLTQKDGHLALQRTGAGGEVRMFYHFKKDQTTIKGKIGVEYTIEKESEESYAMMSVRTRSGQNTKFYYYLRWEPNTKLMLRYRTNMSDKEGTREIGRLAGKRAKFKIIFDTIEKCYDLYINGNLVIEKAYSPLSEASNGVCLLELSPGNEFSELKLDEVEVYEVLEMSDREAVQKDTEWLTQNQLVSQIIGGFPSSVVNTDLFLPVLGKYGSNITWQSSDENLITSNGKVKRPGVEYPGVPQVTMTAQITSGSIQYEKQFTFLVVKDAAGNEAQADMEYLCEEMVTEQDKNEIITSLNLPSQGLFGSEISWKTTNSNYITSGGRVTRPWVGQPDQTVTMVATVTGNGGTFEKELTFTVKADQPYRDPQNMTDEEFFGVWNGSRWTTEGKLDYSYAPGLAAVEQAVMSSSGDYTQAKELLMQYMRTREISSGGVGSRDTDWANMTIDDVYHMQNSQFYIGQFFAEGENQTITANVKKSYIVQGKVCFELMAWYNEISSLMVASANHPDESKRPKVELVVNGKQKVYTAVEDATFRFGDYISENDGLSEYLQVKMFGEFLGNETYRSIIKFDFDDIKEGDKIESAKLILHTSVTPSFAGSKRILIVKNPNTTWQEETVKWQELKGYVYSFQGLPGKNTWDSPAGADPEYLRQSLRFSAWQAIAAEYRVTKDEIYAYRALQAMMDYINDKGAWYPAGHPEARGGYPRTLDTGIRAGRWASTFNTFVRSESMTPEYCTAILKAIWDMANSLEHVHAEPGGNWYQLEFMGVMDVAVKYPEFKRAHADEDNWLKLAQTTLEEVIFQNNFPDGSYVESTSGYANTAFSNFVSYKNNVIELGSDVSPEYDDQLWKGAYYISTMQCPDGTNLQYGDETMGTQSAGKYINVARWYNDKELEFINTRGASGKEPEWTSLQFPDSRHTVMRANWGKDSPFLFTNVRGGGDGHGHCDDNHLLVYAFGRVLLCDSGIFSYDNSDPYRKWGLSTTAHNSVVINDKSQRRNWRPETEDFTSPIGKGVIHDWVTNRTYDFLSQSTYATEGYDHQRSVTFVKPYFWIVSDRMIPEAENAAKSNNYKQIWHMMPNSGITADGATGIIRSNFKDGANVILASADQATAEYKLEDGWFDKSSNMLEPSKYAYVEKDGKGEVTFDTVIVPYQNDPNARVQAQKLDTGVESNVATGMQFTSNINNVETDTYYYLSYEENPTVQRTFGKYQTSGQLAVITEQSNGNPQSAILKNASYLRQADGNTVIECGEPVSDLSVEWSGKNVKITTEDNLNYSKLKIAVFENVVSLQINGTEKAFKVENGYLTTTGGDRSDSLPGDPGGSGGIAGGGGGGIDKPAPTPTATPTETAIPKPTPTVSPTVRYPFDDMEEYRWAQEAVATLYEKGMVKGVTETKFAPEQFVTRAEFLAMVVRLLKLETPVYRNTFTDVQPEDWYSGAVQAGLDSGLISTAEVFRPQDQVSREEMAKIAVEALKKKFPLISPENAYSEFSDAEQIGDWARPYVAFAGETGLIQGDESGAFRPTESAKRAEAAVVLARLLEKLI